MKRIFVILILIFIAILGFRIYQKSTAYTPPGIGEMQKQSGIPADVLVVQPQNFSKSIDATGTIGSEEEAYISAKIPGRVAAVNADAGMLVNKNQILLRIDDSQLKIQKAQIQNQIVMAQSNLDAVKIQMDDAERDYKRMEELFNENVISKKQLESYQVKFETLKKNYESARKNIQVVKDSLKLIETQIEDCIVRAPFSGIIGTKRVETGEVVGAGMVLMTLYNINNLNAQIKVPENYIPLIKKGQEVGMKTDVSEQKFYGKITKISGAADPKTKMFIAYVSISKNNLPIKPGMFVQANIIISERNNVITVPQQAVFEDKGKKCVYIVEKDTAKKVEIITGEKTDNLIEVKSGLVPGNTVVVFGKENLLSGAKVKIVKTEKMQ